MRIDGSITSALALTAGLVTGIVVNKATEKSFQQMEPWKAGTIALGTVVPGLLGASAVSSVAVGANTISLARTGGLIAAGAVVGAALGVGFPAVSRYEQGQK